jgi:hypothetical protein
MIFDTLFVYPYEYDAFMFIGSNSFKVDMAFWYKGVKNLEG